MRRRPIPLLFVLASAVFGQASTVPVPSKWLRDGRLIVPELNFSVDSPKPGSHWSYQESSIQGSKATAFIAEMPPGEERYALVVWQSGGNGRLDDPASKKRFVDGILKSLPGWEAVGDLQMEQSPVPVKGSWKVKTTIRRPEDGLVMYVYSYFVVGKRTYSFADYSTKTSEPLPFDRFVASFALLSPGENQFDDSAVSMMELFSVLFVVGFGLVAPVWWFRRTRGKHLYWQKRWWAIVLGALLLLSASSARSPVPDDLAGRLGSITGILMVAIGGPWLLAWGIRGKRIG